ncbi:MAG: hypothetical protein KAH14_09230 [Clostridiales bacterium]|nr:hypothetical protein [Clostridiales bacterium]
MLKKIKHNLSMKILSVIIAILFWFMVYTNENPIETRQITIALTPVNEISLTNENLRILNEYDTEVEITIRGRKSEIEQVSSADFTAYLDFSSISNEFAEFIEITEFKYIGDRNVNYDLVGSGRVGLNVDHIVAGEIPIEVEIIGETAEGFFLVGKPVILPASFSVVDTSGLVTQINKAVVTVDVSGMKGTEVLRMFCVVLDAQENEIDEYKNNTAVDITVNIAKSVPVEVKLEGVPALDHISTGSSPNPSYVQVSGSEEDLAMIEKVSTLPVNMENAMESFMATTGLQTLPAGVGYVGTGEVDVSVSIEAFKEKTITFNPSDIIIRYGLINKDYDIQSSNIKLVVKGRKSVLDQITSSTVKAYVDVGNTVDGELSLPLRFENLDSVEQMSFPLVDMYIQSYKDYVVFSEDIFIENKNGGKYDYELLNTASNLRVIGLLENIELITNSNLNPTIDAAELVAGTHTIQILVNLPEGVSISGELTTLLRIMEK